MDAWWSPRSPSQSRLLQEKKLLFVKNLNFVFESTLAALTAIVLDWTAGVPGVDRLTAGDALQLALLQDAGAPVLDAVAQLAGLVRLGGYLGALLVEATVEEAAIANGSGHRC